MTEKTTAVSAALTQIEVATTQATQVSMPQQPFPEPTKSGLPFLVLISAPLVRGCCFLKTRGRIL